MIHLIKRFLVKSNQKMALNLLKATYLGPESLTDAEANKIPFPRAEVHAHVAKKCAQASCILGLGLVGPAVSYARGGTSAGEAIECGVEVRRISNFVIITTIIYDIHVDEQEDGLRIAAHGSHHDRADVEAEGCKSGPGQGEGSPA